MHCSSVKTWLMCEWTPPSETRPSKCNLCLPAGPLDDVAFLLPFCSSASCSAPSPFTVLNASTSGCSLLKLPSLIAFSILISSCGSLLPAPMVRWPTSLLPISPFGRPTVVPLADMSVV